MAVRYLNRVQARRQDPEAVNRGIQVGSEVGKLMQGLAGAIKEQQKNALANKLMTDQDLADQPGAGQTQNLGKLDGGDGSSAANAPAPSGGGTPQDLGTLPPDQTFTNPATGDVQPLQSNPDQDQAALSQAMTAARLPDAQNAPTVGSVANLPSGTQTGNVSDADLLAAMSGASPAPAQRTSAPAQEAASDFALNPSDYSTSAQGGKTVGSMVHTGGVAELDLRKEMLAQQIAKQSLIGAQAKAADEAAQQAGTGKYALDQSIKRLQMANIQSEIQARNAKPGAKVKEGPAENVDSEPVTSQKQLNDHIDATYGNGASDGLAQAVSDGSDENQNTIVDTKTNSVTVPLSANKSAKVPLSEAQIYVKQMNALRLKQGLPAFRVPGEDQTVGASAANPYPAQSNLDVYSRAPGTWVKLPNGQIRQVPPRKR